MHLIDRDKQLRDFVFDEFQKAKARNPNYSLRSFSRKLALPVSALSEILKGKRSISRLTAEKVLKNLAVDPRDHQKFLAPFLDAETRIVPSVVAVQLEMDQYRAISDWFHFAILSLSETSEFDSDPEAIALRLGLTKQVASEAIERLVRLGILVRDEHQMLFPTGVSYSTPDGIAERSIRRGHENNLELGRRSLERDSVEQRDFTAMTMAIDPEKLPEAKRRIRKFQNELSNFLESGRKTEVYKICMQLFPLTILEGETK